MTPDERQMLAELYAWMLARKRQQIAYPVDEASVAALGAPKAISGGSKTLTQSYPVSGGSGAVTGPTAYAGTEMILIRGIRREIPYL